MTKATTAHRCPLNTPMRALAVGEIIESRASGFREGEFVYGWFGWQSYCAATPDAVLRRVDPSTLPLSANVSLLGINGLTAYLAFNRLGNPRPGDHVLVSTAAGSVGSFVGQLARLAGCRAVGIAGSQEKARLACSRYGYEEMIDYRSEPDIALAIKRRMPARQRYLLRQYRRYHCRRGNSIDASQRQSHSMRHRGQCIVVTDPHRPTSGARSPDPAVAMVGVHYLRSYCRLSGGGGRTYAARCSQ